MDVVINARDKHYTLHITHDVVEMKDICVTIMCERPILSPRSHHRQFCRHLSLWLTANYLTKQGTVIVTRCRTFEYQEHLHLNISIN